MVTIVKGKTSKVVSFPAYLNFFKDAGWFVKGEDELPLPVSEDEQVAVEVETDIAVDEVDADDNVDDEVADEEWDEVIAEEEVEKPLSEMNREELVAKAQSLGVDVDKKNNKQLREAIKAVM
jgi:hypothetical protein